MTSINDIIKKSFLEGFTSNEITIKTAVVALIIALIISFYIFALYRIICRKTFYNNNFNIALVGVALITTAIILTIQSSIVVSLGMVGALSIVRFRTAIKEPMDLMFMFWSISTGIMCGAGLAEFAVTLALIITLAIAILKIIPVSKCPMILIVNSSDTNKENDILNCVKKYSKVCNVKSRNITSDMLVLTIEVRTKEGAELIAAINSQNGVKSSSLLSHDGEVTF